MIKYVFLGMAIQAFYMILMMTLNPEAGSRLGQFIIGISFFVTIAAMWGVEKFKKYMNGE